MNCPTDFLEKLLDTYPNLKSEFQLTMEERLICTNTICQYSTCPSQNDFCHYDLQVTNVPRNIQELIEISLQDDLTSGKCRYCSHQFKATRKITNSGQFLVFSIWPVRQGDRKLPTKIKEVPSKTIVFNNLSYRFKSMIMHLGDNFNNETSNHYTAWIKNKTSFCINDTEVSEKTRWPTNSFINEFSQSAHLLFYVRC